MIERVLIVNRGEIAGRVARTLRRLGIAAFGVRSPEDRGARHTRDLDHCEEITGSGGASPYLNVDAILEVAARHGIDAIHPGYGYLSENAEAAREFERAGMVWIGPPADAISLLGDKARSKELAEAAGVPVVPGVPEGELNAETVARFGEASGYPMVLKASGGGGGKGMRRIDGPDQIEEAIAAARRESMAAFGSEKLLAERLVEPARHIEIQVAVDSHGNAVALGERECSLQRRYQKLIEESPSPVVDPENRRRLEQAAVDLAVEAGYRNLGTVEFLVDAERPEDFFFLEMNARLQVEHPVTELVTGLDLVEMQLAIAGGGSVSDFDTTRREGHAIEARICAERPAAGFLPATGEVIAYQEPAGLRCDSGIEQGSRVTTDFDPMLMKVIAHGEGREQAIERLAEGLAELTILGVETNADYLRWLVTHPRVREGALATNLVESDEMRPEPSAGAGAIAGAGAVMASEAIRAGTGFDEHDSWRLTGSGASHWTLVDPEGSATKVSIRNLSGGIEVRAEGELAGSGEVNREGPGCVRFNGVPWRYAIDGTRLWIAGPDGVTHFETEPERGDSQVTAGDLIAPLPGTVLSVEVAAGDYVAEGDVLMVIESMKMEIAITATAEGTVEELSVVAGDHVQRGRMLAVVNGGDA